MRIADLTTIPISFADQDNFSHGCRTLNALKVLFVDNITLFSFFHLLRYGRYCETIYHFGLVPRFYRSVIAVLENCRLFNADINKINYCIGSVRDGNGKGDYINILSEIGNLCAQIRRCHLDNDPQIKRIGAEWNIRKVIHHFERLVEQDVKTECFRIGLIKWIGGKQLGLKSSQFALLINRRNWFPEIRSYADSHGVNLRAYGAFGISEISYPFHLRWKNFKKIGPRFFSIIRKRLINLKKRDDRPKTVKSRNTPNKPTQDRIAVRYTHKKITLGTDERSEFFWFNKSAIKYEELLIYDFPNDKISEREFAILNDLGVKVLGTRSSLLTVSIFKHFFRYFIKLTNQFMSCLRNGERASPYIFFGLCRLALDHAFWYEVFKDNHVIANVGTIHNVVGKSLAIDALHGVNFSYQYSTSNIYFPTVNLSSGEDVQFVFSDLFEDLWRRARTPAQVFVKTGFIFADTVGNLISSERSKARRDQLQKAGANYIICYFDENSSDSWNSVSTNRKAAEDYIFLLNWVLTDNNIGLIIKPKIFYSLFQRINFIKHLVEEAKKTGRCIIIESDQHVGHILPAEAAMSSDICVGKLLGATASIEAFLAAVPSVLIDTECFRESHPFYSRGHGRIIFDDWKQLRNAIETLRCDTNKTYEIGNWMPFLNELDPFVDGQGTYRMAQFISWIFADLKDGVEKDVVLKKSVEKFNTIWGHNSAVFHELN